MIRVVIADDEAPARGEIRHLLEEYDDITVAGEADNGPAALELAETLSPDLILLDIQMPGLDGIQTAGQLIEKGFPGLILFITAYDAFALQAFEVHAADYLLKPVSSQRFRTAMDRVRKRIEAGSGPAGSGSESETEKFRLLLESLVRDRGTHQEPISVYRDDRIIPIRRHEILYAEARGRFAWIITARGEFQTRRSFADMEQLLSSAPFFLCHRSYIVNTDAIETINLWVNNTYQLKLKGIEQLIPVSRGRIAPFRNLMKI